MSWKFWEDAADRGPGCFLAAAIPFVVFFGIIIGLVGYAAGWFSEAGKVAQEQLGPRATLKKYEEFKEQAAILEAKIASIAVVEAQLATMDQSSKFRDEREALRIKQAEIAGMKASFNSLAATYNANMSKMNYSFANVGELPKGAGQALPREFKAYLIK